MTDEPKPFDLETALLDPASAFGTPEALLARSDIDDDTKIELLRRWNTTPASWRSRRKKACRRMMTTSWRAFTKPCVGLVCVWTWSQARRPSSPAFRLPLCGKTEARASVPC